MKQGKGTADLMIPLGNWFLLSPKSYSSPSKTQFFVLSFVWHCWNNIELTCSAPRNWKEILDGISQTPPAAPYTLRASWRALRISKQGLRASQKSLRASQRETNDIHTHRQTDISKEGQMYRQTDGCMGFLSILQDFFSCHGRCPVTL